MAFVVVAPTGNGAVALQLAGMRIAGSDLAEARGSRSAERHGHQGLTVMAEAVRIALTPACDRAVCLHAATVEPARRQGHERTGHQRGGLSVLIAPPARCIPIRFQAACVE